ncbi:MAG: TetR/AcrR family transcriptional regulator C-terminal domain-containing protein [Eubacteriales bacterium]|nr:TetR/AcrR family transcriptional regulator C-terminal domain-containing protein [Eubacteriales bacterium]
MSGIDRMNRERKVNSHQAKKLDVSERLAESFKELVLEKPIEKITIQDITDRTGVTRGTFYIHFQDKYALLEWICREEIVNPVRTLLWNDMEREAMSFIFVSILKNKEFYYHVSHMQGQNSFESIVLDCFAEFITDYINEHAANRDRKYKWLTPETAAVYYSQSMAYVLISWIRDGMTVSPAEMVDIYEFVTHHALTDMIREF